MGIKTIPHPRYSPDVGPCDFWLFPRLRGCRYETIEEMKEAVTKIIDTLTQEGFYGAFKKLLERYNKCIAAGEDYFEEDESFLCVLSIKVWKLIICASYLRRIRKLLETELSSRNFIRRIDIWAVPLIRYNGIFLNMDKGRT